MAGMEVFDAVFNNDLDHLKILLKQYKPDLNAPFQEVTLQKHFGNCPLYLASYCGHHRIVQFFIESGCDVNVRTDKFRTPLHSCVLQQQIQCMVLLIRSGAQVNTQDLFGNTPCHYSAENGCCQTLDLLIRSGVDINAHDMTGKTALMKAVRNNKTDAVLRLLQAEADPNLIDSNNDIALHFAARSGFNDLIDVLLDNGSLKDVQNCWGNTPLIEALSNNYAKSVQRLIDAGCDVHCQESKAGNTALHVAVKKNDANLVRILLTAGERQEEVYNHQGETAFFEAVALNKSDILRLMIDFNCRMDTPLKLIPHVMCKSAFQVAAEGGHLATCRMLAELGYIDYSVRDFFYTNYLPARPIRQDASLAWLEEALQHVLSLRQLCRKVVRQCCDHQLMEKVESIPVPRGLKDYLLAKE